MCLEYMLCKLESKKKKSMPLSEHAIKTCDIIYSIDIQYAIYNPYEHFQRGASSNVSIQRYYTILRVNNQ